MHLLILMHFLAIGMFGQFCFGSPDPEIGQTFSNQMGSHLYRGSFSSIREVNFRKELGINKRGDYESDNDDPGCGQYLHAIHYLPAGATNQGAALVLSGWSWHGTNVRSGGYADVFVVKGDRLSSVQTIAWDTKFATPTKNLPHELFDPKTNMLTIRSGHLLEGDARCCRSAYDEVRFRWKGDHFQQTSVRTLLTEQGIAQGKKLPK
jgi:hypothetical protein